MVTLYQHQQDGVTPCYIYSMPRPLRIEFPNALYCVTARGNRREDIFKDDEDRKMFLETLGEVIDQFNWVCQAWCLMDNE